MLQSFQQEQAFRAHSGKAIQLGNGSNTRVRFRANLASYILLVLLNTSLCLSTAYSMEISLMVLYRPQ